MDEHFQTALTISRRCYTTAHPDLPLKYANVLKAYEAEAYLTVTKEEIKEQEDLMLAYEAYEAKGS